MRIQSVEVCLECEAPDCDEARTGDCMVTLRRSLERLARDFPTLNITVGRRAIEACSGNTLTLRAQSWSLPDTDPAEIDVFERTVESEYDCEFRIVSACTRSPDETAAVAEQMLTRFQRYVGARNSHSGTPAFDEVMRRHRAAHDVERPLVLADYEHALDTWQWLLRLEPGAGVAVQIAALFHDIERLISDPVKRVEHLASDSSAFKNADAGGGIQLTRDLLGDDLLDRSSMARLLDLIGSHEMPDTDAEVALLNDADGLSFFSLNASGFVRYYGLAHTRKKIACTLARLRPAARARLHRIRYRPDIAEILSDELMNAGEGPLAPIASGTRS